MRRMLFVLVALVIATLACSLSGDSNEPTAALIPTSSPGLSPTINLTASPISQLNATPTQSVFTQPTSAAPPTVTNCTPRTDWQIYTVQAGDTLGVIADSVGSNVQALTAGNCLANPDSIFVGQQIRVPGLSGGSTSGGSTSGGNTTGGSTTGGNTAGG
ncbi:MAG TPA: LysM peptidoglycan-binding domain-containing protein, partial [Aggregatilineales bacterium]|nr:LysM peptidoglycan-binding domain-containing protein [Aggregatilineales bacterium]